MRSALPSEALSRWCSAALCLALSVAFIWGAWRQTSGFDVWTFEGLRQLQVAEGQLRAPVVTLRHSDGSVAPAPWHADSAVPSAYLVDFIYTRCPGLCLALSSEYQQMQRELIVRGQHDPAYRGVQLLSVSFDVAHDGVPQLQRAAAQWGAQEVHWRFAVPVGEADSRALLRSLGVVAIPDGAGGFVHNGDIHLLDRTGRLRGLFGFDEWPHLQRAS
jgi:protein SCO1/2